MIKPSINQDIASQVAAAVAVKLAEQTAATAVSLAKSASDTAAQLALSTATMSSDILFIKKELVVLSENIKNGFSENNESHSVLGKRVGDCEKRVGDSEKAIEVINTKSAGSSVYVTAMWFVITFLASLVTYLAFKS